MTKFAPAIFCAALGIATCHALPDDPAEYAAWEAKTLEGIEQQKSLPAEEAIPKLALWTYQLSEAHHKEREGRPVFNAAQSALLAIPGHAEYYEKRIKDAQKKVESLDGWAQGKAKSELLKEQTRGFERLAFMPSPETVRVLGEFLFDPWGLLPNAKPGEKYSDDKQGLSPNASRAMGALGKLPLEVRPVQTPPGQPDYWNDIEAWKLWYEQVKAGTRTFRFEGDPQEYSLAGPVTQAREPKSTRPTAEANITPVAPPETANKTTSVPVWPLALAGVILAAAIWLAMKRKPVASRL